MWHNKNTQYITCVPFRSVCFPSQAIIKYFILNYCVLFFILTTQSALILPWEDEPFKLSLVQWHQQFVHAHLVYQVHVLLYLWRSNFIQTAFILRLSFKSKIGVTCVSFIKFANYLCLFLSCLRTLWFSGINNV